MMKRTTTMAALLLAGAAAPAGADDQAEREGRQQAGPGTALAAPDPAARQLAMQRLGGTGLLLVVESTNDRVFAGVGARITTAFWKVDDSFKSNLYDLHRLGADGRGVA